MIKIRKATAADHDGIWEIIREVISTGDTYVFDPKTPKKMMLEYWCSAEKHTFVAVENGEIVGTFFLKENQPGLGSHVGNAGYMVSPTAGGQGIGKMMCEFSLVEAKRLCFAAIQFNFVVKSNEKAVRLWQKMGFEIIGEIPDGFRHSKNGLTNALIMYQRL